MEVCTGHILLALLLQDFDKTPRELFIRHGIEVDGLRRAMLSALKGGIRIPGDAPKSKWYPVRREAQKIMLALLILALFGIVVVLIGLRGP
jgi:hypothetical protein